MHKQVIKIQTMIIGAGPIGIFAATYASESLLKGVLCEQGELGGLLNSYPNKPIIDVPGFSSVVAAKFKKALIDQYRKHQANIKLLKEEVLKISEINQTLLVTTNKHTYMCSYLIIANGGGKLTYNKPEYLVKDYENVFYQIYDDEAFKDKDIVVLGGGDSAVDSALHLTKVAKSVTLIHRRDEFRAFEDNVNELEKVAKIVKSAIIVEFNEVDNKIESFNYLKDGQIFNHKCDAILVQYGVKYEQTINVEVPLELHGNFINVDNHQKSNNDHIYAVGNACYYDGKVFNLACGFGECVKAINGITRHSNPQKYPLSKQ